MTKLPTDRYVLECIHEMYRSSYPGEKDASGRGKNDPYVSIDIPSIANRVGCDAELLFGRLHFHLEQKYGYEQADGVRVSLFAVRVGDKRHAIQFPYLVSILAGLNQEFNQRLLSVVLSVFALGVFVASLVVNLFRHG